MEWGPDLTQKTANFAELLATHTPPLVFTFGSFAFEFARRSLEREPKKKWTTAELGREFRRSIEGFNPREVNVFPLLHRSIAGGHFLKSHKDFTGASDGNYFDYVGGEIGTLLLKHKDTLNVWIER